MVFNSENVIPNSKETNSPKNPSTHTYPNPQHLGDVENFLGTNKKLVKLKEMEFENLNGACLNCDMEMDLSPNITADSLGHIKTSLLSWKRILRNSNPISSFVANEKPLVQTHIKWTSSDPSSIESSIHKKLAIESTQASSGDTLPPCHPP